jgi:hypothetical protein
MSVNDPSEAPTLTSGAGASLTVRPGDRITAALFNRILAVVRSLEARVEKLESAAPGDVKAPEGSGFEIGNQFVDANVAYTVARLDDAIIDSLKKLPKNRIKTIRDFVAERPDFQVRTLDPPTL